MDGLQAFDQPMYENGGYGYGEKFYIFADDLPEVQILAYRDKAYKVRLRGKEGWITRSYPYYKPDWTKWHAFGKRLVAFKKSHAGERMVPRPEESGFPIK